jgi:hypothetical protein
VIDRAVTQSYRDQVLYEQNNRVLGLCALTDEFVRGMGRDEALALLQKTQPRETPFEKDGALNKVAAIRWWIECSFADRSCSSVPDCRHAKQGARS